MAADHPIEEGLLPCGRRFGGGLSDGMAALTVRVSFVWALIALAIARDARNQPVGAAPTGHLTSPLLLLVVLLALATPADAVPPFDRGEWMNGWQDEDDDCQDARTEVLIRQAKEVFFRDPAKPCEIAVGVWVDPYTGQEIRDPSKLDIDHLVPLAEAHRRGGAGWPEARKHAYANFLGYPWHLVAVSASENRRKQARSPADYVPPRPELRCQYAEAWSAIKAAWGLRTTAPERQALLALLADCPGPSPGQPGP